MAITDERHFQEVVQRFAKEAAGLGIEIVDVTGHVDHVTANVAGQAQLLEDLKDGTRNLTERNARISHAVATALKISNRAEREVSQSREQVRLSVADIEALVAEVIDGLGLLQDLQSALDNVSRVATDIEAIAKQTNMLALNATIESARAGEAGKGFAVVAGEVKDLARQTTAATTQIGATLYALQDTARRLIDQGHLNADRGRSVSAGNAAIGTMIDALDTVVQEITGQMTVIDTDVRENNDQCETLHQAVDTVTDGVSSSSLSLDKAVDRLRHVLGAGERLIAITVGSGIDTPDTPFVHEATRLATAIAAIFEAAVATGELSQNDLFDEDYQPVAGTDPQQFVTRFTAFTDRKLQALLDSALEFDPKVVFCAAVDRTGYLPTHNSKYGAPQGSDPAWNAANCRNRRKFQDRVGVAAAQNEDPVLVQIYRRDMGGGRTVLMMDVSAPIRVQDRHWGGLRLAYAVA